MLTLNDIFYEGSDPNIPSNTYKGLEIGRKLPAGWKKEKRQVTWHKEVEGQISAALIIDPMAGDLTSKLKLVCRKFDEGTGIKVVVKLRAGRSLKSDAKLEPIRKPECGKADCLCCAMGHPGGWERNSVGYKITSAECEGADRVANYEGWRWKRALFGNIASWSMEE